MRSGFSIGRIFGINIRIDWSWLFIFFLVSWNLATVFGRAHLDWSPGLSWITAILAALLFFASVLAHELAHSMVAISQGVPVRNITLFLFGGISNIQRNPPSPRAEFLITIVGPITSIALGLLFIWLASTRITPIDAALTNPELTIAQLDPLATLLLWLGPINVLVGLFNLIPGFPLDGGRILRSILWAVTNNLRRATRWAAGVGQVIAWLMIFGGIAMVFGVEIPFFGSGLISGLWLAFIGWFLSSASAQGYQQVLIEDVLEGVPVSRMMRTNPRTVPADISVANLIQDYIMATDDRAFPVVENDRFVGLVTLEDVRGVPRDARDNTTVKAIMTPTERLVVTQPQDEASEALTKLVRRDVRQLPVVQNGSMVGMLRRRDIIRWLQLESQLSA